MDRVLNFSAGPSTIPLGVLKQAQEELPNYAGLGFSIMEISHRTKIFEEVLHSAMSRVRDLYGFSDDFTILFLQGGASLQFAQVPMNLYAGGVAEYANTGNWTSKAIKEAGVLGINYRVIASSEDSKFDRIPEVKFSDGADYGYICSNNTIYGTQYPQLPQCSCPLVVDSSSDLFSRPMDLSSVGMFYGGIQKNGGPAGVTMVAIRKDLLNRANHNADNPALQDAGGRGLDEQHPKYFRNLHAKFNARLDQGRNRRARGDARAQQAQSGATLRRDRC